MRLVQSGSGPHQRIQSPRSSSFAPMFATLGHTGGSLISRLNSSTDRLRILESFGSGSRTHSSILPDAPSTIQAEDSLAATANCRPEGPRYTDPSHPYDRMSPSPARRCSLCPTDSDVGTSPAKTTVSDSVTAADVMSARKRSTRTKPWSASSTVRPLRPSKTWMNSGPTLRCVIRAYSPGPSPKPPISRMNAPVESKTAMSARPHMARRIRPRWSTTASGTGPSNK